MCYERASRQTLSLSYTTYWRYVVNNCTTHKTKNGFIQLAWDFVECCASVAQKAKIAVKKVVHVIGKQLELALEEILFMSELREAYYADSLKQLYIRYGVEHLHLALPSVNFFVCTFIGRIFAKDFTFNFDGTVRSNCAVKRAYEAMILGDFCTVFSLLDSHSFNHNKKQQIISAESVSIPYATAEELSYEHDYHDERKIELPTLEDCTRTQIIVGLKKVWEEDGDEDAMRELCFKFDVDYQFITRKQLALTL